MPSFPIFSAPHSSLHAAVRTQLSTPSDFSICPASKAAEEPALATLPHLQQRPLLSLWVAHFWLDVLPLSLPLCSASFYSPAVLTCVNSSTAIPSFKLVVVATAISPPAATSARRIGQPNARRDPSFLHHPSPWRLRGRHSSRCCLGGFSLRFRVYHIRFQERFPPF